MSKELLKVLAEGNIHAGLSWVECQNIVEKLSNTFPKNQNDMISEIYSALPGLRSDVLEDVVATVKSLENYLSKLTVIKYNSSFERLLTSQQKKYLSQLHHAFFDLHQNALKKLQPMRENRAHEVSEQNIAIVMDPTPSRGSPEFAKFRLQLATLPPAQQELIKTLLDALKRQISACLQLMKNDVWEAKMQEVLRNASFELIKIKSTPSHQLSLQEVGDFIKKIEAGFYEFKTDFVKQFQNSDAFALSNKQLKLILDKVSNTVRNSIANELKAAVKPKQNNALVVRLWLRPEDVANTGRKILGFASGGHLAVGFNDKYLSFVTNGEAVGEQTTLGKVAKQIGVPSPDEKKGFFTQLDEELYSLFISDPDRKRYVDYQEIIIPSDTGLAPGLSAEKLNSWFESIHSKQASQLRYKFYGQNCSTFVSDALTAGGAEGFKSAPVSPTGIKTPREVFQHAQEVAAVVEKSRQITKEQIIHNLVQKRYSSKKYEIVARLQLAVLQLREANLEQYAQQIDGYKSIFEYSDHDSELQNASELFLLKIEDWKSELNIGTDPKAKKIALSVLEKLAKTWHATTLITSQQSNNLSPEDTERYFKFISSLPEEKVMAALESYADELAHRDWRKHLHGEQKQLSPSYVLSIASTGYYEPVAMDCSYISNALKDPVLAYDVLFLLKHRNQPMCLPENQKAQQRLNQVLNSTESAALKLKVKLLNDDEVTAVVDKSTRTDWLVSVLSNDSEAAKNTFRPGLLGSLFGRNKPELLGAQDVAKTIKKTDQAHRHMLVNELFRKPSWFDKTMNGICKLFGSETNSPIYLRNQLLADEKTFNQLIADIIKNKDLSSRDALESHAKTNRQLMLVYTRALYCVDRNEFSRFIEDLVKDGPKYFVRYLEKHASGDDDFSFELNNAITQVKSISRTSSSSSLANTSSDDERVDKSRSVSPRDSMEIVPEVSAKLVVCENANALRRQ